MAKGECHEAGSPGHLFSLCFSHPPPRWQPRAGSEEMPALGHKCLLLLQAPPPPGSAPALTCLCLQQPRHLLHTWLLCGTLGEPQCQHYPQESSQDYDCQSLTGIVLSFLWLGWILSSASVTLGPLQRSLVPCIDLFNLCFLHCLQLAG